MNFKITKVSEIYNYSLGKFSYKTDLFTIDLKFQGFCEYLGKIFSTITWLMIFLDFFTRSQKIMFKSIFKSKFDNSASMYYAIILSYIFYIITMSLINFDLPKNSENEILKKLIKDDANAYNNDSQNNVYESGNKVN